MAGAFFGNNSTIKISSGGSSTSSGSYFTTTSTQYAIVSVTAPSASYTLVVGSANHSILNTGGETIYVGPSTAVSCASNNIEISWVIFENSP